MKKIISVFLIMLFLTSNFSFAQTSAMCRDGNPPVNGLCPTDPSATDPTNTTCNPACDDITQTCDAALTCIAKSQATMNQEQCGGAGTYNTSTKACEGAGNNSTNTNSPTSVMGISCNQDQLVNGQCKLSIYDTLGIRKSVRNSGDPTSVGLFVQDIILSATFFIGTLVTIALVVSGLMFIFAASSGKDPANAKKGIMESLIGLLIVVSSYVIIRLVQYIAKGF